MKVPGIGPKEARLVILGEAPGRTEAEEGIPFVGPSGELLRSALEAADLNPDDLYITNVYKEYRQGNPTPTTEEITESLPELLEELQSLPNLEAILLVGNVPLQALTGRKGGILRSQGDLLNKRKLFEEGLPDVQVMAVMHPAYVLRNNNYQTQSLFKSVVGAFAHLGLHTEKDEEVLYLRDEHGPWEQFLGDLNQADAYAIDIEATPVPWWHPDFQILTAGISFDGKRAYVIDTVTCWPQFKDFMREVTENGLKTIMHNGAYDRVALLSRGISSRLTFDTMAAQYLIDPDMRKGLQYLSSTYLGLSPYKDVDYKNIQEEPWEKVADMNGLDAIRTFRLYNEVFKPRLVADERLNRLFQFLLMPAINALCTIELRGVPVDEGKLDDLIEEYERTQEQIINRLRSMSGDWDLKPNSVQQMQKLIFDTLSLPVPRRTATGGPSLDAASRKQLRGMHPIVDVYDEYKTVSQRLGTFLYPWADMVTAKGRLHPHYKATQVKSGRLSCEKPNFQQIPGEAKFRGIFGGAPGRSIISLDYSQIELRLAAMLANEKAMLAAYRAGEDLHTRTAEIVLGDPSGRQVGKILNFGLLYGAGPAKLAEIAFNQFNVEMTLGEAEQYHRDFFAGYPNLKTFHRRVIAEAHADGYTQSLLGRRRYLPNLGSPDYAERGKDERVAVNHQVQSLAGDLMLLSLIEMEENGFGVIGTVHDSAIIEAPTDSAEDAARVAAEIMENIGSTVYERFGVRITVPLQVDVTIGDYWTK